MHVPGAEESPESRGIEVLSSAPPRCPIPPFWILKTPHTARVLPSSPRSPVQDSASSESGQVWEGSVLRGNPTSQVPARLPKVEQIGRQRRRWGEQRGPPCRSISISQQQPNPTCLYRPWTHQNRPPRKSHQRCTHFYSQAPVTHTHHTYLSYAPISHTLNTHLSHTSITSASSTLPDTPARSLLQLSSYLGALLSASLPSGSGLHP